MAFNAFMESKNVWLKLNADFAAHFFLGPWLLHIHVVNSS